MNLQKIKTILINILGEEITSWFQAIRFIFLIKYNRSIADPEINILSQFLNSGDIAVDVGANGANWTYHLSRIVGKSGFVYAFEADSYYALSTKRTIMLMRIKNAKIFPFGLSDKKEQLPLMIRDENGLRYTGKSFINKNAKFLDKSVQIIKLNKLDSLIPDYSDLLNVSLIKCDVEGYELYVFKGSEEIIKVCRPTIIIEVGNFEKHGYNSNTLYNYFRKLNYSAFSYISNNNLAYTNEFFYHPESKSVNRILIPTERVINYKDIIIY